VHWKAARWSPSYDHTGKARSRGGGGGGGWQKAAVVDIADTTINTRKTSTIQTGIIWDETLSGECVCVCVYVWMSEYLKTAPYNGLRYEVCTSFIAPTWSWTIVSKLKGDLDKTVDCLLASHSLPRRTSAPPHAHLQYFLTSELTFSSG
jgi:hypothetical protein